MAPTTVGHWSRERMLGSGKLGEVELWKEECTERQIVIKKFHLFDVNGKSEEVEYFEKETKDFHSLDHPNLIKYLINPIGFKFDSPVVYMEFCNYGDLRKILNKPENACGLAYNEVYSIMKDISSSLMYLHDKNIIHWNIKPENIVLHALNGMIIYKLIDLAHAIERKSIIASADGIHNYVAPELFSENEYTRCSIDYWSLGILFFEVLTGYSPFMILNSTIRKTFVENKKYNDICAAEINGKLEFYDYIIYPNDVSEGILNSVIEWFQIVLQCDSKQRGKYQNSDEVVIFPALNKILSTRIIYIFSLSFYRIDKCNINSDMTLLELQQWIEQTISIPISEQLIADITGSVLNKSENSMKLPIGPIPNSILYVYKTDSLEIIDIDSDFKLPKILDIMLIEPKAIKDHSLLRQCYTALIYLMKYELKLFKHYIFALSTRLDILNNKLNTLNKIIEATLPNIKLLLKNINAYLEAIKSSSIPQDKIDLSNQLCAKIENLYKTFTEIMFELEIIHQFNKQIKEKFDNGKFVNNYQKYLEMYDDLLNMYSIFQNNKTCSSDYIINQVNILSESFSKFEEQKITQLHNSEITTITKYLSRSSIKLESHFEILNSAIELIQIYSNKFVKIVDKSHLFTHYVSSFATTLDNNTINKDLNFITNEDAEIKDNIVLRALLDKYIQDIRTNWSIISL